MVIGRSPVLRHVLLALLIFSVGAYAQDTDPDLEQIADIQYEAALQALLDGDVDAGSALLEQAAQNGKTRAELLLLVLQTFQADDDGRSNQERGDVDLTQLVDFGDRALARQLYELAETIRTSARPGVDRSLAVQYYLSASDLAFMPAILRLGEIYRDGDGVGPDVELALGYFDQAAQAGSAVGSHQLGQLLIDVGDVQAGIAALEAAADGGNAAALRDLGRLYRDGGNIEPEMAVAIDYFERAADAGEIGALVDLGATYRDGIGVETDVDAALRYFEQASQLGSAFGTLQLGQLLIGSGDVEAGIAVLSAAADAGNTAALRDLGRLYRDGESIEPDMAVAIDYFERAADAGEIGALVDLGTTYRDGIGVETDSDAALQYFEQASRLGSAFGTLQLGRLLIGSGDIEAGIAVLSAAADAGNSAAMRDLGRLYRDGGSTEPDIGTALAYLERAAEAGEIGALVDLGVMYRDGIGVERDLDAARQYFDQASQARSPVGTLQLGQLLVDTGDVQAGLNALRAAADAGQVAAKFQLGELYRSDLLGSAQAEVAFDYFFSASALGHDRSRAAALVLSMQTASLPPDGRSLTALVQSLQGHESGNTEWIRPAYASSNANSRVRILQILLVGLGFDLDVDGLYGAQTISAIVSLCTVSNEAPTPCPLPLNDWRAAEFLLAEMALSTL